MKHKLVAKLISVVAIASVIISSSIPLFAYGEESTTAADTSVSAAAQPDTESAQKTLEQQKKELEKSIADSEKKLKKLEKTSKNTQEYVDALDQKIGAVNDQLTVLQNHITQLQGQIDVLKPQIEESEKQLAVIQEEVDAAQSEIDKLSKRFNATYDAYCYRLRAMYISGDYSILSALLTCKDVSGFLTRYEMIKMVSKSDTELLQEVNSRMEEICIKQNGLNEKKAAQQKINNDLAEKKKTIENNQKDIEANQETIANKKVSLAQDKAQSDRLLAELNEKNKMYTEFRNEDEELSKAVENEINDLINGLKTADEVTTAVKGDQKVTTSKNTDSSSGVFSKSDAVLNMKYPVPGHYTVSAGFPNYSSGRYHGGIDFPCPKGSKVVAAQSGIVIKVKRLDYSYGYYVMIYHGTDSNGRTVVTLYGHNSSILVSSGQTVAKGQQIAKSGSTGNSTGPHCHFEIRLDSSRVNPKYYLSK